MVPKLRQVNIVVRDMEAMAAFYERLGLPMVAGQPEWAADHRSARSDDAPVVELDSVEFTSWWNQGWGPGNGIVLAFEVPDRAEVDRLYDQLVAAGARSQQSPYDAFWGARFAVVADPDGNAVAVMSPVDAAYRSALPRPPHER